MSPSVPMLAGLIGHPVGHSKSPVIHGHWLDTYGINGKYLLMDVTPARVPQAISGLAALGFRGCNVTIPHKEAVFDAIDVRSPKAERLGVVNTVVVQPDGTTYGTTTDGDGFIQHLQQTIGNDLALDQRRVVIYGAGGAARSIVGALSDVGCPSVTLCNRNMSRANALCALAPDVCRVTPWDARSDVVGTADLLINTTSLGMIGHAALDVSLDDLASDAIVTDIVYTPLETDLLRKARQRGARTADGLGMLLHQAVEGFELWYGTRPVVTDELRQKVIASLNGA